MYVKIKLKWDYTQGTVTLLSPGYISMMLARFCNQQKIKKQDSPHPFTSPKYGRSIQFAPTIPEEKEITKKENKFLEQVLGALVYYEMAIDCTMLVAVNSIAVNKKYAMRATMDAVIQLFNYAATHLDAKVTF